MAEKQRGFIADNITVTPKRYGKQGENIVGVDLSSVYNQRHIKENAAAMARGLNDAFMWEATAEGPLFWEDIYNRLKRIAREGH